MFPVLCITLADINKDTDHPVKLRQGFEVSYYSRVFESLIMTSEEGKIRKQRQETWLHYGVAYYIHN